MVRNSSVACLFADSFSQHTPDFQDEEEMQKRVLTSYRPAPPPESTLLKKHQRLSTCLKSDPELIQTEIARLREEVKVSRQKVEFYEQDYEEYYKILEKSRNHLGGSLNFLRHEQSLLQRDTRELLGALFAEIHETQTASVAMEVDGAERKPSAGGKAAIDMGEAVDFGRLFDKLEAQLSAARAAREESRLPPPPPPEPSSSSGKSRKGHHAHQAAAQPPATVSLDLAELVASHPQEAADVAKWFQLQDDPAARQEPTVCGMTRADFVKLLVGLQSAAVREAESVGDVELFLQDLGSPDEPDFLEAAMLSNEEFAPLLKDFEAEKRKRDEEGAGQAERLNQFLDARKEPLMRLVDHLSRKDPVHAQALAKAQEELVNRHVLHLFAQIDAAASSAANSSLAAGRKKRKANDLLQLRTFVRSRIPEEQMVLFSPLSSYEHYFLGSLPAQSLYSAWYPGEEVRPDFRNCLLDKAAQQAGQRLPDIPQATSRFLLHSAVPRELASQEDEQMAANWRQSEAAVSAFKILKLEQGIEELEKLLVEGQASLTKSQAQYRHILQEDANERLRMKATLLQNGLLSAAASSGQTCQEILEQLEVLGQQQLGDAASSLLQLDFSQTSLEAVPTGGKAGGKAKRGSYPRGGKAAAGNQNNTSTGSLLAAAALLSASDGLPLSSVAAGRGESAGNSEMASVTDAQSAAETEAELLAEVAAAKSETAASRRASGGRGAVPAANVSGPSTAANNKRKAAASAVSSTPAEQPLPVAPPAANGGASNANPSKRRRS